MWYVIQTISGTEHEVCLWINCNVDKRSYDRCFVPLFEDVWKKDGIGHISVRRMFEGYLFLESDMPEAVNEELKRMPKFTNLLSSEDKEGRKFIPLMKEEEAFFDDVLSDGIMRVSYIHTDKNGEIDKVIGPLAGYRDSIIRVDFSHRYAIVSIPFLGRNKTIKMGLWLESDPKISWIEEENKRNDILYQRGDKYEIGGDVVNIFGLYGDMPLKIQEVHPDKNSITVAAPLFGRIIKIDMDMRDVKVV